MVKPIGVFCPISKQIADTVTVFDDKKIQFRDTGIYIYSSADGILNIVSDGTIVLSGRLNQGTNGSPVSYTAGTPLRTIYATNAGTSGSTSAEPFYLKSVLAGAGQVGGRCRFHTYSNVASGGWVNALKGYMEFGASGSASGLASAIVGELVLSAGTSVGTYCALEAELVLGAGASVGTATSFLYCGVSGAAASTFEDNGFLLQLASENMSIDTGHLMQAKSSAAVSHTLRIKGPDGGTYYLMVSDAN